MKVRNVLLLIGGICFLAFIVGACSMAFIDFRNGNSVESVLERNPSMQLTAAASGKEMPTSIELRLFSVFWLVYLILGIAGIISIFKRQKQTVILLSLFILVLGLLMYFLHPGINPSNGASWMSPSTLSKMVVALAVVGSIFNLILHTYFKKREEY